MHCYCFKVNRFTTELMPTCCPYELLYQPSDIYILETLFKIIVLIIHPPYVTREDINSNQSLNATTSFITTKEYAIKLIAASFHRRRPEWKMQLFVILLYEASCSVTFWSITWIAAGCSSTHILTHPHSSTAALATVTIQIFSFLSAVDCAFFNYFASIFIFRLLSSLQLALMARTSYLYPPLPPPPTSSPLSEFAYTLLARGGPCRCVIPMPNNNTQP